MSARIIPLMEQQRVLKLFYRNRIVSGVNVEKAVQKLHSHGRKYESEKEKRVMDVAGAKGEECHCLTETECVSKAVNK